RRPLLPALRPTRNAWGAPRLGRGLLLPGGRRGNPGTGGGAREFPPPFPPLRRAHAELLPEPEGEVPEVEAQVQRPTHLMLRLERMRPKRHQPRRPAVVGAVGGGALLQLQPTRRLKLLRER